ncbi:MAG: hypothetical protein AAFV53_18160 [Myxococcota bacterium]
MSAPRVLVVEDGHEYITNLERFLADDFSFTRAGDGQAALDLLSRQPFDAIFLDMKFDRADRLLGDLGALQQRFAGDEVRAKRFLENNQGAYILAALREAGHPQPALFSYDFDSEPRRFKNLIRRYGPLAYLTDTATPHTIRKQLQRILGR